MKTRHLSIAGGADAVLRRELEALFATCPDLSPEHRQAIEHMGQRVLNKFLHHPRAALRSAAAQPSHEHPHSLLNTVRHLSWVAVIAVVLGVLVWSAFQERIIGMGKHKRPDGSPVTIHYYGNFFGPTREVEKVEQ